MLARPRVEHPAAAERVRRRDLADHDPVAPGGDERPLETDLPEAAAEPRQTGRRLARAVVDLHSLAVFGLAAGKSSSASMR